MILKEVCAECKYKDCPKQIHFWPKDPQAITKGTVHQVPIVFLAGRNNVVEDAFIYNKSPRWNRLQAELRKLGFSPNDCAILSCFPCSLENGAKDPSVTDYKKCAKHIHALLQAIKPKVVVTLGGTSVIAVEGKKTKLKDCLGSSKVIENEWGNYTWYSTYDPFYLLSEYSSPEAEADFHNTIKRAIATVRGDKDLASSFKDTDKEILDKIFIPKTLDELKDGIQRLKDSEEILGFDTETRNTNLYGTEAYARGNTMTCMGFSYKRPQDECTKVLIIPLAHFDSPFYCQIEGYARTKPVIQQYLKKELEGTPFHVVGHNMSFDLKALKSLMDIDVFDTWDIDDTMILNHLTAPNDVTSNKLKSILSSRYGLVDHSQEDDAIKVLKTKPETMEHLSFYQPNPEYLESKDYGRIPFKDLTVYLAKDVLYLPTLYKDLKKELDNWKTVQYSKFSSKNLYEYILKPVNSILARISSTGFHVNPEKFQYYWDDAIEQLHKSFYNILTHSRETRLACVYYNMQSNHKVFDMDEVIKGRLTPRLSGVALYLHTLLKDKEQYEYYKGLPEAQFLFANNDSIKKMSQKDFQLYFETYRDNPVIQNFLAKHTNKLLKKVYDESVEICKETYKLMDTEGMTEEEKKKLYARKVYDTPEIKKVCSLNSVVWKTFFMMLNGYNMDSIPRTPEGALSFTSAFWNQLVKQKDAENAGKENVKPSVYHHIVAFSKMQKLNGTFQTAIADKFLDYRTGRVHGNFNLISTATGRLSSTEPNMQNQGKDAHVKGFWGVPEGYVLMDPDFSQAEVRVAASLSADPGLVGICDSGEDIHSSVAHLVFNLPCDPSEVKEKYSKERFLAKSVTFGLLLTA